MVKRRILWVKMGSYINTSNNLSTGPSLGGSNVYMLMFNLSKTMCKTMPKIKCITGIRTHLFCRDDEELYRRQDMLLGIRFKTNQMAASFSTSPTNR